MRSFFRGLAVLTIAVLVSACGGGGSTGGGITPITQPTSTPVSTSADCPSTGSLPSSQTRGAMAAAGRLPGRGDGAKYVPGLLAVQYASAAPVALDATVQRLHASRVAQLSYSRLGMSTRVVHVDPQNLASAISKLRRLPGVKSVTQVAYRRRMTVTANDMYFVGNNTPPFDETPSSFGQWDMHVINVEGAWSQFSGNVTGAPIAVIDTGVDVTHPDMQGGLIQRTRCFVTYPTTGAQSTGTYVTDTDGHGTDVAGIADSLTDNGGFGFAGTAHNAPLMAYRIFPSDPPGGCDVTNPPAQCDSDTVDEASAINDAVTNGAQVINLSLGGDPPCSTSDPEYLAVENAVRAGVVVVAASGNGSSTGTGYPYLDCPAADPGVIAVGASALVDTGYPNVTEDVASYSNYLNSDGTGSGGAYLVAPGGDVTGSSDTDNLHWINNLYSSTAYDALSRPSCSGGLDSMGESNDCNVEIVGTSMATPHVAGVVSLMLGINPKLSPQQIATGLCTTAVKLNDNRDGCGRLDAAAAVQWAKNQP